MLRQEKETTESSTTTLYVKNVNCFMTSLCVYSFSLSVVYVDHSLILPGIPTHQEAFLLCIFSQCFLKHPLNALPLHCYLLSVATWGVRRLLCRDYSSNRYPGFGSLLQGYQALVPAHASKYLRHHLRLKSAFLSPRRSFGCWSLLRAQRDIRLLANLMF